MDYLLNVMDAHPWQVNLIWTLTQLLILLIQQIYNLPPLKIMWIWYLMYQHYLFPVIQV